jgi:cytochrome c peroxidase
LERQQSKRWLPIVITAALTLTGVVVALAQAPESHTSEQPSSYMPVDIHESFSSILSRMSAAKPQIMKRQMALLNERYDLSNRPAQGVTMARRKPIRVGVRVKLPEGMTWEQLAAMSPEEIRERDAWPAGFYPLPHPNHPEGGMVFPKFEIDELKKQEARDLTRFDLDFDLPDHFLPEFPPPIFLTTRPDLGDVSQGKLVTIENYYQLFNGLLNPKQLDGLRLLLTPFPQQQFNQTEDRRSLQPSRGVACFDCHANGHTNGATHLVGDIRPQAFRHRGELAFFVGGDAADLDACRPLLQTMGRQIVHVGGHGMGTSLKMVNNLLLASSMAAFAEGLVLGEALGISQERLFDFLLGTSVVAPYLAIKREKIERGDYAAEFALQWMQKDLHLAAVSAQETGVALPLANAAKETYQLAVRSGYGPEDLSAIYAFLNTQRE